MSYVPPFAVVKQHLKFNNNKGKLQVTASYEEFLGLVKTMLRGIEVDEAWYLANYPDVARAVQAGMFKSAKHHFVEEGYFEGRRPSDVEVDDGWYLRVYDDVAAGVKTGKFQSAKEHFVTHGYVEGRLPTEY